MTCFQKQFLLKSVSLYCITCIVSSATVRWLCIILFITKELSLEFSLLEVSNMLMYFFIFLCILNLRYIYTLGYIV